MAKHLRNTERGDPIAAIYRTAKGNAKRDRKEFTITKLDLPPIPDLCPVLGIPLVMGGKKYDDAAPSLDRIDNTKGYVPGNVIFISRRANRLKGDATPEELRKMADFYGSVSSDNG